MYLSKLDLKEHVRASAAKALQASLSDALDLEAQLKQAHWNVKGDAFFQLHQLFDSVHSEAEEFVDLLAERITALGHVADGRIQTSAKASRLDEYPLPAQGGEAHLRAVAAALAQFGARVRSAIEETAALGDAGTSDLFTQLSRETDKQLWFVEAHLVTA